MLGGDGAGLDLALSVVLPWFLVLNAAASTGFMQAVTDEAKAHLTRPSSSTSARRWRSNQSVGRACADADRDGPRRRIVLRHARRHRGGARGRAAARARGQGCAGEAAIDVTDLAMLVCGGAAFRKELGIERRFRDARAARVMAPTTDALHDFIGRALSGLPLLGEAPA